MMALLGLAVSLSARAQLTANFTPSAIGGCSPLTVTFTNTTLGASASATYNWDFGNGNQTSTQDINAPEGATYATQQAYTVTLTVTDGGKTSTKSVVVTVYKTPTVAFGETGGKGCVPVPVSFTSTSTPGDGTIAQYFWDFGDGNTRSVTSPTVSNTYQYAGNPTVSLTVTNSHGCSATLAQPGLLAISPAVLPAFAADSPTLCQFSDPELFTNTTTGPPTLSYLWRFGDGTTSTGAAPSHTYTQKGVYNVTLIATSTVGCTDSVTKTAYINAEDFTPVFTYSPAQVCMGSQVTFTDKSTPAPNINSYVWSFGNTGYVYDFYNTAYYTFTTPGTVNVTMSAMYGTCPVSTTQAVKVLAAPSLTGFVMHTDSLCGPPLGVKLTDTAVSTVSRAWAIAYGYGYTPGTPFATTPTASYTFTGDGYYYVALTTTNASGCTATVYQPISVEPPQVYINVLTNNPAGTLSCDPVTVNLSVQTDVRLTKYYWNFGDGTSSTDSLPTHTYTAPGNYTISLQYTNANGCTGTVSTYGPAVDIMQKPVAKFSISPANPICGNTPVTFTSQSTNAYDVFWDYGDGSGYATVYGNQYVHQYTKEGTYTITMVAVGYTSYCRDTLTKVDSVVVLPAFPLLLSDSNTCQGNRGAVFIADSVRGATSATWDFGDGTTQSAGSGSFTGGVVHDYTRSGRYKVVLTTVDGQCSTRDSTVVDVLLKQKPLLGATVDSVCGSGPLSLTISGLDTNYLVYNQYYYYNYYYPVQWQYGDGSVFNTTSANPSTNYITGNTTQYGVTWSNLTPGKDSIRVILQESSFGNACLDTSNWLPVKIDGPVAAMGVSGTCWKYPVLLSDSAYGTGGVPITQWVWNFGDGSGLTAATGANVSHTYTTPNNYYYPSLKVTDARGCSAQTGYAEYLVYVNGPKADFSWTPANISPGTTATFTNNSVGPYYSALWTFASDGSTSNSLYSVDHTYPNITTDTVTLVVTNPYAASNLGCTADTVTKVIPVRNVNAAFTFTTAYVNNNNCPPVVVYFNSTSFNITDYQWDFGDGSTAQGNPNPSHTYNKPGKYYITLTATGAGQTTITVTDSVTVKGPYASVSADISQACLPDKVTLSAAANNAVSYTWDFGDGTVISAADTFETHTYIVPGVYNPALILKDSLGCAATFNPSVPVVVDSLRAQGQALIHHLCDSGSVGFGAQVYSLSNSRLGEALTYHWDFGTGNPGDTADTPSPVFRYTALGNYIVRLTTLSTPGCVSVSKDSVLVTATAPAQITGPAEACLGDTLRYLASPERGAPTWEWIFPNGSTDTATNPLVIARATGTVQLISTWNGCADTTEQALTVHALPDIAITPPAPRICLGASVALTAHDGQTYAWAPVPGLDSHGQATVNATPVQSTTYPVTVTNVFGCRATDSVFVFVARPFQLQLPADTTLCIGDSLALEPGGAYSYQWADGSTVNPLVVDPQVSTTYTVVGYDQDRCFTDTATIQVAVVPRPTVHAAPVGVVIAGTSVTLQATGSTDITSWWWTPPDYLSCTACADPVSTPHASLLYTVTGETGYGCKASDTVRIQLICVQDRVAIPGGFSPNHDGYNDVFYPKGSGVRVVSTILIYGRWGKLVFERHNAALDDPGSGWDGTSGGIDQPVGAYVYEMIFICDTGETFVRKGTVLLER